MIRIERLPADELDAALPDLGRLLHDCVHDGASVGFVMPFSQADAETYWQANIFASVRSGGAVQFVAREGKRIVGTVLLGLAVMPNQVHRADVSKLLVSPEYRRRGIARRLMGALMDAARAHDRRLLVLDTRSGDPSQALYESLGFKVAGQIPGFCRNPFSPQLEPTTYLYCDLDAPVTPGAARPADRSG